MGVTTSTPNVLARQAYAWRIRLRLMAANAREFWIQLRGRPLALPQDAQQRITKLQHWLENLISDVNGAA